MPAGSGEVEALTNDGRTDDRISRGQTRCHFESRNEVIRWEQDLDDTCQIFSIHAAFVEQCIMIPAIISQPKAMVGTTIARRPFTCLARYFGGSSTPTANKPTPKTTRMTSNVIKLVCVTHEPGSKMSAQYGPIRMPKAIPRMTSLM